jgi:hypothetical protein
MMKMEEQKKHLEGKGMPFTNRHQKAAEFLCFREIFAFWDSRFVVFSFQLHAKSVCFVHFKAKNKRTLQVRFHLFRSE